MKQGVFPEPAKPGLMVKVFKEPPAGWDAYVARHSSGTAYHRSAAVLVGRRAFGLETHFMVACRGDDIAGVLPLVEQSSFIFGRFITSVPFFTYGGILADDDAVAAAFLDELRTFGAGRRAEHIELRHDRQLPGLHLPQRTDKVSMVLDLPGGEEALAQRLGSKLRSQIRRAQREQVEIIWGRGELVSDFYKVFSLSMRNLGTPVYPQRFFDIACEAFGELASVVVLKVRGEVQAAAILVRHRDSIEVPWAAASEQAKRTAINMRMYWELLAQAMRGNAVSFDFGRSTVDSGTYRFKAQWGAQPRQLHWDYVLFGDRPIPQLNASNAKLSLATAAWKRLPLWLANALGPMVIRNLP